MLVLLKGNDHRLKYPYTWIKHKRKDPGKKIRTIEIRAKKDDRLLGIAPKKMSCQLQKRLLKILKKMFTQGRFGAAQMEVLILK